jgi:hypothetical protein
MGRQAEWTLSEAARLLSEPQHRLIYLCEKKVVIPDHGEAEGRGSSRRFSARNLLEFALALKLRNLTIPVGTMVGVVYVLRGFERTVAQQRAGFDLVTGLRAPAAPELRIIISDGEQLYFLLGGKNEQAKLFGGIDFQRLATGERQRISPRELHPRGDSFGGPEGSRYTRLEVDVTRLAKDLPLTG